MNVEQQIFVKRLIEAGLNTRRFLKLDAEKAAFEDHWPEHLYTPEEMGDYPYWGVCGGGGLVPIDADTVTMDSELRRVLPATLEVRTARRGLTHFFLVVEGGSVENKTLFINGSEEGCGELRTKNYYVVACGTQIHYRDMRTSEPKIGRYTIAQDRPIARMQYSDFMKIIEPYLGSNPKQPITHKQMRGGVPRGTRHSQGMKFANYLIGIQRFHYATALFELQRWNQLCKPPMDNSDLERMVNNAVIYIAKQRKKKRVDNERIKFLKLVNGLE